MRGRKRLAQIPRRGCGCGHGCECISDTVAASGTERAQRTHSAREDRVRPAFHGPKANKRTQGVGLEFSTTAVGAQHTLVCFINKT